MDNDGQEIIRSVARTVVSATPRLMRAHYNAGDIEIIIFFYRRDVTARRYSLLILVDKYTINCEYNGNK